ncbi:MAG: hypothetical protein DDT22_00352 [candidate division WS2 bacterium]|nr:hypothetical protein [Candidatus Lithacetigena glycinireducens]MBT9174691.1 hypothetical protein [Candidatus Lithacetigena glycinireducens]
MKEINLERKGPGFSHTLSPSTILTLSKQLYGSSTKGYIMSIKGYDFDLGEGLSPMTEKLTKQAIEIITNLVENWSG